MSQHDFNIANQTFPSFRADLNDALQAAATISAGATAPTTPYAYQLWYDTANEKYMIRNAANSAWLNFVGIDTNGNVDVTGTVTADGLTVSGDAVFTPDNDGVRITGTNYATLRLEENDTTDLNTTMFNSGGKFSIYTSSDDRASATERVTLDHSTGNLGIGTSSPAFVTGSGLEIERAGAATLRLEDTGSGGKPLEIYSDDGEGYVINGLSSGMPMIFKNNNTERMRIDSSGNLLVGTASAYGVGTTFAKGANGTLAVFNQNYGNGFISHQFRYNGSAVGSIVINTSSTAYNTSSDYRLKTAVNYDWDATTRLKQLKPARFKWIADGDDAVPVDGFLAHEVEGIVPEAITGTKDGMRDEEYEVTPAVLDDDGNVVTPAVMGTRSVPDYQGIDQSKLVPLLVKTIQELEARITALEAN